MSNAVAVNDNIAQKSGLQKMVGFGIMAVSVIEAVIAYFLVLNPLFIKPVFDQATEFTNSGTNTIVRIFGKLFVSEEYIASNNVSIVLSLSTVLFNVVIILSIFYVAQFVVSFFFLKGSAFANTFFFTAFGIKFIVSISAFILPFANIKNSMRIFSGVDAAINLAAFCFFLFISMQDTIAEMLWTDEDVANMKKRVKKSAVFFVLSTAVLFLHSLTINCYGGAYSLFLGWNNTAITAGFALVIVYIVAFLACVGYIKDQDWSLVFFGAFGAIIAIIDILGIVGRVQWLLQYFKYKGMTDDADAVAWLETNKLTMAWGVNTGLMVGGLVIVLIISLMAVSLIRKAYKKTQIADEAEKKSRFVVNLSSILILGAAVLSLVSSYIFNIAQFGTFTSGSFDFIYMAVYCGFSAVIGFALFRGYSWARWGVIAVSIASVVINVSTVIGILAARSSVVAVKLAEGVKFTGYNFIIAFIILLVAMIIWGGLAVAMLAFKNVPDYLYKKRYN